MRIISSVLMIIFSLSFVELPCQFRTLPLTARFASSTAPSTWPCVRPAALSLEPFVAGQVAYRLRDLAFGLVYDLAHCLLPFGPDTPLSLLP